MLALVSLPGPGTAKEMSSLTASTQTDREHVFASLKLFKTNLNSTF